MLFEEAGSQERGEDGIETSDKTGLSHRCLRKAECLKNIATSKQGTYEHTFEKKSPTDMGESLRSYGNHDDGGDEEAPT